MTPSICPCDGAPFAPPTNLPQLSHIAYRVGTYRDFRRSTKISRATSVSSAPALRASRPRFYSRVTGDRRTR